jgi:hypothetical protein
MSRRVTTETEIRDRALALQAIKTAGLSYSESGSRIQFTSGALKNAILDLITGVISGDSDYGHSAEKLSELKMFYGEAKYRLECVRNGIMVESRSINKGGEIEMICAYG